MTRVRCMILKRHIFLKSVCAAFLSFAAICPSDIVYAADQNGAGGALHLPTSAWLVGPASLASLGGQTGRGLPCVMANQFDNGYMLRFSVVENKVLAIALDFRGDLFVPGDQYTVRVTAGKDFDHAVNTTAFDKATLIANMQKFKTAYSALKQADELDITFGETMLRFSLAGVGEGLSRAQRCTKGRGEANSNNGGDSASTQESSDLDEMSKGEIDGMRSMGDSGKALPEAVSDNGGGSAEASALFELSDDRKKASEEANSEKDEAEQKGADETKALLDHYLLDAGRQTEQATSKGLEAMQKDHHVNHSPAQKSFPAAGTGRETSAVTPVSPSGQTAQGRAQTLRWSAKAGGSLKAVLEIWAEHAGARLVWNTDRHYYLPQDFTIEGNIGEAAPAIAREFPAGADRPVIRVFDDPSRGGKFVYVGKAE